MITPHFSLRTSAIIIAVALQSLAPLAQADVYQDVGKLIKQGQFSQALEKTDQYLATIPKDPQARFMKGLILTELNRTPEAIVVFTKLTEEFPESPEPYNNLAVIYAQQKQYDKAREALETAIRTHPSYATAHENLGDIYAHMASQAYDKALQIDSSNASAQTKLAMIRDMMTSSRPTSARPAGKTVATATAAAQPAARPEPVVVAAKPTPAATTTDSAANADAGEIGKTVTAWAAVMGQEGREGLSRVLRQQLRNTERRITRQLGRRAGQAYRRQTGQYRGLGRKPESRHEWDRSRHRQIPSELQGCFTQVKRTEDTDDGQTGWQVDDQAGTGRQIRQQI